jgi:hypothetical protein
LHQVSDRFIGVNIDAASLYQGTPPYRLDFNDKRLLVLSQGLVNENVGSAGSRNSRTMVLRVGGSSADGLWWGDASINGSMPPYGKQQIRVDQQYWDEGLMHFAAAVRYSLSLLPPPPPPPPRSPRVLLADLPLHAPTLHTRS